MIPTDYKRRYIIDLIEIRRERLKNIMNNLFHSYIKYVILAYSKPPAVSNCYNTLRKIDALLEHVESLIIRNGSSRQVTRLLSELKKLATGIGGETQAIIDDLIENIYSFYNR